MSCDERGYSSNGLINRQENLMRLHVPKNRFFRKGDTIKIATDYDNEVFYDAERSMSIRQADEG